jgi:hypothetical protein
MTISTLPTPPSRTDSANFRPRADALLTALPTFVSEANALAADVNAKQAAVAASEANVNATIAAATAAATATATAQAGIATTKAGESSASAAGAAAQAAAAAVSKTGADAALTAAGTKATEAASSAGAAALARDAALAGLGAADQSLAQALLAYGVSEAIDLAGQAIKGVDRLKGYFVQSGTVTITQSASIAVDRTYASAAVVLPRPYQDAGYQVVAEIESAVPAAAFAGQVTVSNRAVNGFSLSISGSATSAVVRWKTIHMAT